MRKRGPEGCEVLHDGELLALPIVPGEVVDSTGAGDALAAGFLVGGDPAVGAARGPRRRGALRGDDRGDAPYSDRGDDGAPCSSPTEISDARSRRATASSRSRRR